MTELCNERPLCAFCKGENKALRWYQTKHGGIWACHRCWHMGKFRHVAFKYIWAAMRFASARRELRIQRHSIEEMLKIRARDKRPYPEEPPDWDMWEELSGKNTKE